MKYMCESKIIIQPQLAACSVHYVANALIRSFKSTCECHTQFDVILLFNTESGDVALGINVPVTGRKHLFESATWLLICN